MLTVYPHEQCRLSLILIFGVLQAYRSYTLVQYKEWGNQHWSDTHSQLVRLYMDLFFLSVAPVERVRAPNG